MTFRTIERGIVVGESNIWAYDVDFRKYLKDNLPPEAEMLREKPLYISGLMAYVTYWDRVAYLGRSTPLGRGRGDFGKLAPLVEANVLCPTAPRYPKSSEGIRAHRGLFERIKAAHPSNVSWTLGRFSETNLRRMLGPRSSGMSKEHEILISLYQALPTPAPDTSPIKILKLRETRRDELLHLRSAIRQLQSDVSAGDSSSEEIIGAKEDLEKALHDIARVMKDGKIRHFAGTLKSYLSLSELTGPKIIGAVAGAALAPGVEIAPAWGALAGFGTNAALTFMSRPKRYESLDPSVRDYLYAYRAGSMS